MLSDYKADTPDDGQYDMDIVMRKFVEYFYDIYGQNNEEFVEDNGRKLFLLYLKTIINGMGNHYIEAQTRDARRSYYSQSILITKRYSI